MFCFLNNFLLKFISKIFTFETIININKKKRYNREFILIDKKLKIKGLSLTFYLILIYVSIHRNISSFFEIKLY